MDMEISTHLPDQHDQLPAAGNAAWRSAASLIERPQPDFRALAFVDGRCVGGNSVSSSPKP
jgi:hypothetical protein